MKKIALITGWLLMLCPVTAPAGDNPLLGTWKLKSFVREVFATGERYHPMGEHAEGYLSYLPDGRMWGIVRIKPNDVAPTDEERVKLHRTMVSYAGTYTLDNDKVVHRVDISWNQGWTGTDQVRFYKLDGNTLTITSPPAKSSVDGREGRSILIWEKIKPATQ
jgi:hypothetical protein